MSRPALGLLFILPALVLYAPTKVLAQACVVIPGEYETGLDVTEAAIDTNTDLDIEDVDYTIQFGDDEIIATLAGLDADMQLLFGTLSGSNTNNSTMQNGVNAKGQDYQASTSYTQAMQLKQADEQKDMGAGNLAYMANNLCQQTTQAAGASAMTNAIETELVSYNGYIAAVESPTLTAVTTPSGPTCTTCGGDQGGTPSPPVGGDNYTNRSAGARIHDIATVAAMFGGSNECNAPGDSQPLASATDTTTPATHLDQDAMTLAIWPTYSDTFSKAHMQLQNYLQGLPPQLVSNAPNFCADTNKSVRDSSIVAHNEKMAFYNLSGEALQMELAEHNPVNSGAAATVKAIYKAANKADPTVTPSAGNAQVSEYSLEDALYKQPGEDPQFFTNLNNMNTKSQLAFIGGEMLLLNRMEYLRYQVEKEQFKVQSASLNLQQRSFNFTTSP